MGGRLDFSNMASQLFPFSRQPRQFPLGRKQHAVMLGFIRDRAISETTDNRHRLVSHIKRSLELTIDVTPSTSTITNSHP